MLRSLSPRKVLTAIALAAGVVLALDAARAADLLSIGERPEPSTFRRLAVSSSIGFALGGISALYLRRILRSHRRFFIELRSTPPEVRELRLRRWNLLYGLPLLLGLEILVTATFVLEVPRNPALLAAALWLPVIASPLGEILRGKSEGTFADGAPGRLENASTLDMTNRRVAERLALTLFVLGAGAFTGYTLALPRLAEIEESRAIVRQMFAQRRVSNDEFYEMTQVARVASRTCSEKRLADGEDVARRLLKVYPGFLYDWNYGNAIHYANLVLGRIALRRGDTNLATLHLRRAGGTPGSPQIGDYGPDMTLARELLERGESDAVLRYFSLCSRFWRNENRNCVLTEWFADVRRGRTPDFGHWAGPVPRPSEGWTCEALEADVERVDGSALNY